MSRLARLDRPGPPYEQIWETFPPGRVRGARDLLPLMRDLPRTGDPGAAARYNNGAYVLAGLALEEVTCRVYPDIVREEVFGPLGMTSTGFWALDDPAEPDLAIGYQPPAADASPSSVGSVWRTNVHAVPALGLPDGGAQATAGDLVHALDAVLGLRAGAGFLTEATRARMIGPHATSPGEGAGYGLGVISAPEGGIARIGHSGEDPGFSCRAWTYPATGERVVVQ